MPRWKKSTRSTSTPLLCDAKGARSTTTQSSPTQRLAGAYHAILLRACPSSFCGTSYGCEKHIWGNEEGAYTRENMFRL